MPAEFLSGHSEKIVLLILKSNLLLWKMYVVFLIVNFDFPATKTSSYSIAGVLIYDPTNG